jgi:hypothetical protein
MSSCQIDAEAENQAVAHITLLSIIALTSASPFNSNTISTKRQPMSGQPLRKALSLPYFPSTI